MNQVDILRLALAKEKDAIRLYGEIAAKYPGLQEFCSFLMTEEQKHQALLEQKLLELTT